MSKEREKYNLEFKKIEDKFNSLSFKDLFENETEYSFNKANQSACPFPNCASGKSGRKGSDGAFKYYPSLNIGKCYSCGQSAGNTKLLKILHGFSYPELIHYVAEKYFHTHLENPSIKIKVSPSKRKLESYIKPTNKEILAEKAKLQQKFNYIKELALKNDNKDAKEYLQNRGINTKLPFYQLQGYKGGSNGVVFFDSEKRFLNERFFKVEKGANKTFSYGEMKNSVYCETFIPEQETLFVTEGVINALSLFQEGQSTIALFATTNYFYDINKFSKYFSGKNVVIAFDFDKNYAGQKAAIKHANFIAKNFNIKGISIILFPSDKDANDLLQEETLQDFIDNDFNYIFPSISDLGKMTKEIRENYHTYKPNLKPKNYFNRPVIAENEPDGLFIFKKLKKIPAEIIEKFKGFSEINEKTFKKCKLLAVEEYSIVHKGTVHIHKSTIENPIFIIEDTKHILRPFSQKPYKKIESYNDELYHHGLSQIEAASLSLIPEDEENSNKQEANLARVILVYNFIDFVNLTAFGEYPLFINGKFPYHLKENVLDFAKEIYQVPANNQIERKIAREIAIKNITIKTLNLPNYNKSISDFLKSFKSEQSYILKKELNKALPIKFWSFQTKGKTKIFDLNVIILRNFLSNYGYFTYQNEYGAQDYSYIRITGRIVQKIEKDIFPRVIENFVDNYLANRGESVDVRNKVSISARFTEKNLSGLKTVKLDFDNSTKNSQNWFFADGNMWTATKDGIKQQAQRKLNKYIWEEELLKYPSEVKEPPFKIFISRKYNDKLKEIELAENKEEAKKIKKELKEIETLYKYDIEITNRDNYFLQFLFATSFVHFEKAEEKGYFLKPSDFWYNFPKDLLTKDEIAEIKLHFISKITWLGYFMKSYRNQDDDFGMAILDAIDSLPDNRKRGAAGGGKSLITKGISEIKTTHIISAESEDFTEDKHRYQNYNGERVIVCDDMHLKSRVGNMLTDFSNGIDVNKKHKQSIPIPFNKSPKIIITRNYIDMEGERVDRRLGRMFVYPFFHDNKSQRFKTRRKPADWFGRMLYTSDTEEDKSNLVNFFAYACVANFNFGEINPPIKDMNIFRIEMSIGEPLIDFLDDYFDLNSYGYIDRTHLYKLFIEDKKGSFTQYQRTRIYNSAQKFKNSVEDWCSIRNLVFNPEKLITDTKKNRIRRKSEVQLDNNGNPKTTEHFYIDTETALMDLLRNMEDIEDIEEQPEIPF